MPGKVPETVVQLNGQYINILHPPGFELTPETVQQNWERLIEACVRLKCNKVLVEGHAPKRKLSIADQLASGKTLSDRGEYGIRVAFCFTGYELDEKSNFLETVTANRGTPVRFFRRREDALAWLDVPPEAPPG